VKVDRLNTLKGVKRINVKPQCDKCVLPTGRTICLLAEGRLMNLGCAIRLRTLRRDRPAPSFVMSNSCQCLTQLDLWKNEETNKVGVYRLPEQLDEEVAWNRRLTRCQPPHARRVSCI